MTPAALALALVLAVSAVADVPGSMYVPSPPPAAQVDLSAPSVRVAFSNEQHLIVVEATINGTGPYRFLLDTGASFALTPSVARRAGLELTPQPGLRMGGNGPESENVLGAARVPRFEIGGVTLRDATALVIADRLFDGIIGYPIFSRTRVNIDFPAHTLVIEKAQPGEPLAGFVVPMFITLGHFPSVVASIDGVDGIARLDTGSNRGLFLNSPFGRAHPQMLRPTSFGSVGSAVGGLTREAIVAPIPLSIGRANFGRVDTSVSLLSSGMSADPNSAATIGTRVFEHYAVTFDYPGERVAFEPH